MRQLYLFFSLAFTLSPLCAQDAAKKVIEKVFYEKKVREVIFFEYQGTGQWPHRLRDGVYAFILPDSIFRGQYPNILNELAASWANEQMLSTKTFIARKEGTVFITNGSVGNGTYKLLIRFDKLKIEGEKAILIFHTTSVMAKKDSAVKYVRIKAMLNKVDEEWKLIKLRVINIPAPRN
ncbi:MAG: hypothetical protein HOP30_16530 [Cyclobacteriaceae bacterium]|nr:hypothetical protein [Cyclobacteriaceae bacterium]